MENLKSNSFLFRVQELFFFYDRAAIGLINKAAIL
jgi:hypothetical protein